MKKKKVSFTAFLHLVELYQEQYIEAGFCLSPEQSDASFRDFVVQYYSALNWGKEPSPKINADVPLF